MNASHTHLLEKYFPELSGEQLRQFGELPQLYQYWNDQINVISRRDIDHLMERHVLHSLAIARFIQFSSDASVLDVGTGGGFPGIPLAIFFPHTEFHLVDSIGKKIKVVAEVSQALGLKNVKAEQVRAEQLKGRYDFIVSRAVTRLKPFLQWVRVNIKQESRHPISNGLIALKGGNLDQELSEVKRKKEVIPLASYFSEEFFETKKIVYLPLS